MLALRAVSMRRLMAAAASLMAVCAGAAGAAWAQDSARVRWEVIADISPLPAIRHVPTEAQRQIASEAATLAAQASGQGFRAPRFLWQDLGVAVDDRLPYFGVSFSLSQPGGPSVMTALHLLRSGHPEAVQLLQRLLEERQDRSLGTARLAIGMLSGEPPPSPAQLARINELDLMLLALVLPFEVSSIQGDLDAARAQALVTGNYLLELVAHLSEDGPPLDHPSAERIADTLVVTALVEWGQLSSASEIIRRGGLLQGCNDAAPGVETDVERLVEAARWAEAASLIASADRSCLTPLLGRYSTDRFVRAGQGPLLRDAIETALARRPAEPSAQSGVTDLFLTLLRQGLIEAAERELALQRELGAPVEPFLDGALAAAAVVRGDRVRVERYWGTLDRLTGGDTGQIADLVAMFALSHDPEGPWRERAVNWLGLDAVELDHATARYIQLLDPGRVALSPALAGLVRRVAAGDIEPSPRSGGRWVDMRPEYSMLELRFAAGDADVVLEEIRAGELRAAAGLVEAAFIAMDDYRDPVLSVRILALTEDIARLSASADAAPAGATSYAVNGLCAVAIVALQMPEYASRALDLLLSPDLLREDGMIDHCRAGAAMELADLGDPVGALRAARAVEDPSIRAIALAAAIGPAMPPALLDWARRMHTNGRPAPLPPVAPQSPAAGQR